MRIAKTSAKPAKLRSSFGAKTKAAAEIVSNFDENNWPAVGDRREGSTGGDNDPIKAATKTRTCS